jgi:multiple sugar transport system ATP-binding protein
MIYVTHDQVEALTLADRIVVLEGGDIQQVGSPLELYERPANKFVAQFIGSPTMNVVPVEAGAGGVTLVGRHLPLPHLAETSAAAELGIRPEHIDVVHPDQGKLKAVADVVEHLGSDTNIYAQVEGIGAMMVRVHGNIPARSGDLLGLNIQPQNAHVFAADGSALRHAEALAA